MPSSKKGAASGRASQSSTSKKPRWNAEQRAAKGLAPARSRGTASKPQRARAEESATRRDAVERGQSTRPNWEPRGSSSSSRPFRGDRPARDDRAARDDRPRWERDDRTRNERPVREDRPRWERDDRTRNDSPRGERTERPRREGFDRDRAGAERPRRDDRPARSFDRDERPARRSFDRDDRPQRSFDRDERPARRSFDRDERPARRSFDRDERPARRSFDRDERPARRSFDRDERPARRSFDGDERPARRSFDRDERPARRSFDRDDRAPRSEKPAFVEDVVLEKLQAEAVDATDVAGTGFAELGLGANIVRALADLGAESPFPIQAATIPAVLEGRDVLGRGRTGSGKTIAFGAPTVERLMLAQKGQSERRKPGRAPRALILAPTRELALQIDRTVQPIAQAVGLFTTQIYGGVPYARQTGALARGVDIVIGTPGRVQDLQKQGRLDLSQVVVTVLDEADHMCELGFYEPVRELLQETSDGGQKLLYSATLDKGVASLVDEFLVDPAVYEIAGEDQASGDIRHVAFLLDHRDKQEVLAELASGPGKKLVFARTRSFAEELADMLDDAGVRAESIHGDLTQSRRTRALEKFTNGRVTALVATDVAARGIHVDDVDLVIQADAPDEYKSYLHRSGRTGRAGKSGTVVTLVPRNRRRRTEDLFARAEITPEWVEVRPGSPVIADFAG